MNIVMNKRIPTLLCALALGTLGTACVRVNSAPTVSADHAQAAEPAENPEAAAASQSPEAQAVSADSDPAEQEELRGQPSPGEGAMPSSDLPPVSDIQPPICKMDGTRSEGWYRDGKLLTHASCKGMTPECKMSGTRSEGWYAGGELIEYDQCDGKLPE